MKYKTRIGIFFATPILTIEKVLALVTEFYRTTFPQIQIPSYISDMDKCPGPMSIERILSKHSDSVQLRSGVR